ncbi:MAG TPA: hypothetical protein VHC41_01560 [Mycobacteriales bacterium]|nr:hypothetical protein [Mycobacteriales bacterium]
MQQPARGSREQATLDEIDLLAELMILANSVPTVADRRAIDAALGLPCHPADCQPQLAG